MIKVISNLFFNYEIVKAIYFFYSKVMIIRDTSRFVFLSA